MKSKQEKCPSSLIVSFKSIVIYIYIYLNKDIN